MRIFDEENPTPRDPRTGRKQIHAKMMLEITKTDKACAERLIEVWQTMLATTARQRRTEFATLEEFAEFRRVDAGAL